MKQECQFNPKTHNHTDILYTTGALSQYPVTYDPKRKNPWLSCPQGSPALQDFPSKEFSTRNDDRGCLTANSTCLISILTIRMFFSRTEYAQLTCLIFSCKNVHPSDCITFVSFHFKDHCALSSCLKFFSMVCLDAPHKESQFLSQS